MNESELIAAAQRGSLRAYNELVLFHQSVAYNVAFRLMGDADDAADATQDAFIKAHEALHQFHGGSFRAWLLRIVTNTCYDMLRVRQRQRARTVEEPADDDAPRLEVEDAQPGPEAWALNAEMARMIQAGIVALPEDQRTVLVLADIEGFTYQEICDIVGTEMGTVKSRLSRARARLREYLEENNVYRPQRREPKQVLYPVAARKQAAVQSGLTRSHGAVPAALGCA